MPNRCNGVCIRLSGYIKGIRGARHDRKICKICNYKIKTVNINCPCCKLRYRVKTRLKKDDE